MPWHFGGRDSLGWNADDLHLGRKVEGWKRGTRGSIAVRRVSFRAHDVCGGGQSPQR